MKLDPELVRKILLASESMKPERLHGPVPQFDGEDPQTVRHHIKVLDDEGYLKHSNVVLSNAGLIAELGSLTFKGHAYLDAIRQHNAESV